MTAAACVWPAVVLQSATPWVRPPVTATAPRLNDAPSLAGTPLEPDEATLRELAARYRPSNLRLFELLGRDLGWHDDPRYEYYRERFFFDYKFTVV